MSRSTSRPARAATFSPASTADWEREASARRPRSASGSRARGPASSCPPGRRARPRCSRRFGWASAARSPAAGSTSRGSTSTTWSGPAALHRRRQRARPGQPDGADAGDQTPSSPTALGRVLHRPAVLPVPGARAQGAVRRDGGDRAHRPAGDPRQARRARLHLRVHPELEAALRDVLDEVLNSLD